MELTKAEMEIIKLGSITLTELQYGVIMQAIENAKNDVGSDDFIDPYSNEEEVTNEQVMEALLQVEDKLTGVFLLSK